MKKIFSFLAAVLFAGSMMADSYTITFKEGNGTSSDGSTKVTSVADIIADGASYVSEVATATNVYNARVGRGIKLGTSSKAGELTLTLAAPVQATSIVVTARKYNDSEKAFTIQGQEFTAGDGDDFAEYTYTYIAATEISSIALASPQRIYFTSVTVNYGEGGDVPPVQPTAEYYLVGNFNNWQADAAYKLVANPGNADEMMISGVELAADDSLKIIGILDETTTWYPDNADNYVVTADGEYDIYFRADGQGGDDWYYGVIYAAKKEAPIVHQYEVAEAIAAGLADDTEIMVRGVVTKIEFKGKNFAKYGSANIYVADVNGAEGVFEFYNCYSFNADTFRVSSPEYDATSTAWAEFDMVADENGNAIYVGDTVIAFGNYKLYNTTHELNTGCYIVDVKHAEPEVLEDGYYLVGTMNDWTPSAEYMFYLNEEAAEGVEEYLMIMEFAANSEFKVRKVEEGEETAWYPAEAGNCTINDEGFYTVYFRPNADGGDGWYEGVIYNEKMQASVLELTNGEFYVSEDEEGLVAILDLYNFELDEEFDFVGDGDELSILLLPESAESLSDLYSVEDFSMMAYLMRVAGEDTLHIEAVSGELELEVVSVDEENAEAQIIVSAAFLGDDNVIYTVEAELTVYYEVEEIEPKPTEAIENTKVANKAIKRVEMGKVVIYKNGVKYSVNGQLMK